jgi:hypothetical protein
MKTTLTSIILVSILSAPALSAELHKPHAFDFSYNAEVLVIEGIVRGTWRGHTHSAIFLEPQETPETDTEGTLAIEFDSDTPRERTSESVPSVEHGELTPAPTVTGGDQPGEPSPDAFPVYNEDINEKVVEETVGDFVDEPPAWELETYPSLTLERAGWKLDELEIGDRVVVAIKRSTSTAMHGQLLGISRFSDGWTGLGHPFPDGLDMETVVIQDQIQTAGETPSEAPPKVSDEIIRR